MKSKQLLKKQISFILIAIGMFFFSAASAQIVYTDVNPDEVSTDTYNLDLNNDGIIDYSLSHTTFSITSAHPWCLGTQISHYITITAEDSDSFSLDPLPLATTISTNLLTWNSSAQTLAYHTPYCQSCLDNPHCFAGWHSIEGGLWLGISNQCLGLQFYIGSQLYYGWIQLSVASSAGSFTVKGYAFNSVPNQSILAGQTCPPQAVIIANGSTTFCAGDSVILSSANSGTNLSYKWKLNGSNISGATNKTYSSKAAAKYKVNVTDNTNGCSATSALVKVKVPCRMINENLFEDANILACYPNPFSQLTTISFSLPQSEKVSLQIFDVEGRLIRTLANESMSEGAHTLTWDARDENGNAVSEGIYFLKMETSSEAKTMSLSVVQ